VETLDLHGCRYNEVELLVENWVLLQDLPARIITGNSPGMRSIVLEVLKKYRIIWWYENHYNLGAIIIGEQ
jgi:hypothetical protein